jgi:cell wall-associated NlpC family hydrolase
MISRSAIIGEARSYLQTPFHHMGRRKGVGVDCIGLVHGVAETLDVQPRGDLAWYPKFPDGETLTREFDKYMERVPIEQLQPGDVLVFVMPRRRSRSTNRARALVQHAGIIADYFAGGLSVIHTWLSVGMVVEHVYDQKWRRRSVTGYQMGGVEPTWRP